MTKIEIFQQIEVDHELFDVNIGGFQIWPYLRFSVYMQIEQIINKQNKRSSSVPKPSFRQMMNLIWNCTINNPLLSRNKCRTLFITHARRSFIDGKYECLYTDSLNDIIDNSRSAEYLYSNGHLTPLKTKKLIPLDFIDIFPLFLKVFFKNSKYNREIDSFCSRVSHIVSENYNIEFNAVSLMAIARKRYVWHKLKKCLTTRLLQRISPQLIIEVVSYETNKMIVNEVAKELGIKTVELQHGVIGPGHIAYNYKKKCNYKYLPDYVFLFSDFWKETADFPQNDQYLIPVGYPYLDRLMLKYPYNERNGISSPIRLLVISQPEYSFKLLKQVKQLIEELDKKGVCYVLNYKLHPSEYTMDNSFFYEHLNRSNIQLIDNSDISLYELFANSDIQIGVTSTAIFEGLAYNLKTLILHFEKTDLYMGNIVDRGLAVMCDDYKQLLDCIQDYQKMTKNENCFKEDLFKPNAIQNIVRSINNILESK